MNQHFEKIASFPGLFRFQEIFTLQFPISSVQTSQSCSDGIRRQCYQWMTLGGCRCDYFCTSSSCVRNNELDLIAQQCCITYRSFLRWGGSLCLLSRKGPSVQPSLLTLLFLFIEFPLKFTLNNLTENLRQLQFGKTKRCVSTILSPSFSRGNRFLIFFYHLNDLHQNIHQYPKQNISNIELVVKCKETKNPKMLRLVKKM